MKNFDINYKNTQSARQRSVNFFFFLIPVSGLIWTVSITSTATSGKESLTSPGRCSCCCFLSAADNICNPHAVLTEWKSCCLQLVNALWTISNQISLPWISKGPRRRVLHYWPRLNNPTIKLLSGADFDRITQASWRWHMEDLTPCVRARLTQFISTQYSRVFSYAVLWICYFMQLKTG